MNTYAPLDQEIKRLCQRYQARLLTLDEQTVTIAVTGCYESVRIKNRN